MGREDKYFQFPLCALAQAGEEPEIMQSLVHYGLLEAGRKAWESLDEEETQAECALLEMPYPVPDPCLMWAMKGEHICQTRVADLLRAASDHERLTAHRDAWVKRHGPEPLVRVAAALCLDVCTHRQRLSFREFRVLCAIYSALGQHTYRAINARTIRVRALGCKNEAVAAATRALRRTVALTEKQLRGTITRLHETGWFARVTPHRHGRVTYYSHRMGEMELAERIISRRTFAAGHAARRQATTAEITRRIAEARAATIAPPLQPVPDPVEPFYPEEYLPGDGEVSPFLPTEGPGSDTAATTLGPQEGDYNRKPPEKKPLERKPLPTKSIHSDPSPEERMDGYLIGKEFIPRTEINTYVARHHDNATEIIRKARRAWKAGDCIQLCEQDTGRASA